LAAVLADHAHVVWRAFAAAVERPGREFRARIADGEEAVVRAHPIVHDDAAAADELALATRFRVELHAIDVEAVARLVDLGRTVVGLPVKTGEDGRVAVASPACAPAAELRLDDRVLPPGVGMDAPDEGAAHAGEMAGSEPVRHVRSEASPQDAVNPQPDRGEDAARRPPP